MDGLERTVSCSRDTEISSDSVASWVIVGGSHDLGKIMGKRGVSMIHASVEVEEIVDVVVDKEAVDIDFRMDSCCDVEATDVADAMAPPLDEMADVIDLSLNRLIRNPFHRPLASASSRTLPSTTFSVDEMAMALPYSNSLTSPAKTSILTSILLRSNKFNNGRINILLRRFKSTNEFLDPNLLRN